MDFFVSSMSASVTLLLTLLWHVGYQRVIEPFRLEKASKIMESPC